MHTDTANPHMSATDSQVTAAHQLSWYVWQAIELAFELNRPLRLWKILQVCRRRSDRDVGPPTARRNLTSVVCACARQEVMETPVAVQEDGEGGGSVLDEYVRDWNDEAVGKVLSYIRDWNTNAKHVMVAQVGRGGGTSAHSLDRQETQRHVHSVTPDPLPCGLTSSWCRPC